MIKNIFKFIYNLLKEPELILTSLGLVFIICSIYQSPLIWDDKDFEIFEPNYKVDFFNLEDKTFTSKVIFRLKVKNTGFKSNNISKIKILLINEPSYKIISSYISNEEICMKSSKVLIGYYIFNLNKFNRDEKVKNLLLAEIGFIIFLYDKYDNQIAKIDYPIKNNISF